MKKRNQVNFEMLESVSKTQQDIRKKLFLHCAKQAVRKTQGKDKQRRQEQFDELKKSIMPEFSDDSLALKRIEKQWRKEEIKWWKKQAGEYERTDIINSLSYRLLSVFFTNHIHCPFYIKNRKGRKPDCKDFQEENQKLFRKFLNQSITVGSFYERLSCLARSILKKIKKTNIHESCDSDPGGLREWRPSEIKKTNIPSSFGSAAHKLYGKDWDIAKGLVIGGAAGGVAGVFLGPVIGGYIGKLAGLSGAAATSYGLALLGGGSLASGGLGMAGGSAFLGLGFGIANGVRHGAKGASIDELNMMQSQSLLPALLATGRALFESGDGAIPDLIHKTVSKRLKEQEQRLKKLESEYDANSEDEKKRENLEKSIQSAERSVKLYRRAKDMSLRYDWQSGYDIWKSVF